MSFVCPLPPIKVLVRAEYLYDFERGHEEYVQGVWCTVKSIKGEAFRFETYLPEYGALFDKLPISAFKHDEACQLGGDLPLDVLQIWDAMSYDVTVIDKPMLKGLRAQFYGKDRQTHTGEYMFTLDCCSPDPRIPDFGFSESMDEHKSFNLLKLDNGQFALQPNNRCLFFDAALNPQEIKFPDFKVATKKFRVENKAKWRLGDTTDVTYDGRGE
ncbi:hypothetical protein UFOVP713_34 [uncultured Caudovirales phage]|uniref:Uncharacterized protein n=1 Tax=uncultured Caudovirales phage TaxID=2100421 RepID=A0A6J5NUM1_9CAUD|nr:hypothetical protein UFOVP713_34 [uncultured Caudovirales phage]